MPLNNTCRSYFNRGDYLPSTKNVFELFNVKDKNKENNIQFNEENKVDYDNATEFGNYESNKPLL